MAMMGKELEPKTTADRLAEQAVDGYIERIEKQAEIKPPVMSQPATTTNQTQLVNDAAKKLMGLAPKLQKQTIVLPLDEDQVKQGLHHKVMDAIRWLAEWSVYMIKKYPGRVFYRPKQS